MGFWAESFSLSFQTVIRSTTKNLCEILRKRMVKFFVSYPKLIFDQDVMVRRDVPKLCALLSAPAKAVTDLAEKGTPMPVLNLPRPAKNASSCPPARRIVARLQVLMFRARRPRCVE